MRKIFPLQVPGRHPDRVLDACKHSIRQYLKRERRVPLPEGADFWDFDCRFGLDKDSATVVHLSALTGLLDSAAAEGAAQCYVEILAKPAQRQRRPEGQIDNEAAASELPTPPQD